ncbi:MAG: DUF2335 domain-containing protein [Methylococcus sp.]|nr:DUF2335 domain-containing protein [Methylococcus sp.]
MATSDKPLREENPVPPPQMLEHYERILPGAAERIIHLAEEECRHRHEMDRKAREAEISLRQAEHDLEQRKLTEYYRTSQFGQIAGIAVSVLAIGGALGAAFYGAPWQISAAIMGLPIAGIVLSLRA